MRTGCVLATATVVGLLVFHPAPGRAQGGRGAPPSVAPAAASRAGMEAGLLPDEPVVTQHSVTINGQAVSYAAEAGWLPIREDGRVVGKMFYVAYTRSGVQDPGT
ncbi:MAG: hypothetical protein PVH00_08760, partial [Gemmatimonadota bacterium]